MEPIRLNKGVYRLHTSSGKVFIIEYRDKHIMESDSWRSGWYYYEDRVNGQYDVSERPHKTLKAAVEHINKYSSLWASQDFMYQSSVRDSWGCKMHLKALEQFLPSENQALQDRLTFYRALLRYFENE